MSELRELLQLLNDAEAEYLVVGAHAVMFYAEPRFTKDLNVWVNPTAENAPKVVRALAQFGAPLGDAAVEDFQSPGMVFQIGVDPNRIDIVMGIDGVEFRDAWPNRTTGDYAGVPMNLIGKAELILNKRASGRPQDLLDLARLLEP